MYGVPWAAESSSDGRTEAVPLGGEEVKVIAESATRNKVQDSDWNMGTQKENLSRGGRGVGIWCDGHCSQDKGKEQATLPTETEIKIVTVIP